MKIFLQQFYVELFLFMDLDLYSENNHDALWEAVMTTNCFAHYYHRGGPSSLLHRTELNLGMGVAFLDSELSSKRSNNCGIVAVQ